MSNEVKRYSFDEICDSQDFNHKEEFVLHSEYEHLKTKLELTNKELGLNIKSHLNDICTLNTTLNLSQSRQRTPSIAESLGGMENGDK